MITIWPVVIFLNHLKSSGRCHGILGPFPITRFSLIAAMALKCFMRRHTEMVSRKDREEGEGDKEKILRFLRVLRETLRLCVSAIRTSVASKLRRL